MKKPEGSTKYSVSTRLHGVTTKLFIPITMKTPQTKIQLKFSTLL
jgi:hypothetical protein